MTLTCCHVTVEDALEWFTGIMNHELDFEVNCKMFVAVSPQLTAAISSYAMIQSRMLNAE